MNQSPRLMSSQKPSNITKGATHLYQQIFSNRTALQYDSLTLSPLMKAGYLTI
jgi:hypothetical protein